LRRYLPAPVLGGGTFYGTYIPGKILRDAATSGLISVRKDYLREGERLDVIAGAEYGDSRLWWVIAGASGIGWNLQVPPGTYLLVPTDLVQVAALV
tara:strand:+ start:706 stop:993 length:288 start_codon:yes stop_codon:yes gene_type:complete